METVAVMKSTSLVAEEVEAQREKKMNSIGEWFKDKGFVVCKERGRAGTVQISQSTRAVWQLPPTNWSLPRVTDIGSDSVSMIEATFWPDKDSSA